MGLAMCPVCERRVGLLEFGMSGNFSCAGCKTALTIQGGSAPLDMVDKVLSLVLGAVNMLVAFYVGFHYGLLWALGAAALGMGVVLAWAFLSRPFMATPRPASRLRA